MKKQPKYSPEVIERAVRMVSEAAREYSSQWAAIESIAAKIGCTPETLRRWVRQQERDTGQRPGPTTAEDERIKALEREVRELRKANEILRLASAGVVNAYLPTTAELQALGFAASGFSDPSQPGGPMVFQIAREPVGCVPGKCILSLMVYTSGSVEVKGQVDAPFAQAIAGYVPNGAGWSNLASDVARLGKTGRSIPNPLGGGTPAVVAAVAWVGNNQASQTVPPVMYNYRSLSCGSGYTGTRDQQQSVTTDKYGNTTIGSWVTYASDCTPTAAPTQAPTPAPTQAPTQAPTLAPTQAPTQAPSCIPGYGSTSAGVYGYCTDCDNVAWVDGSFAANTTATERGCYLTYGSG